MAIPQILLTKVTIPQLPRRILFRERVQDQLLQALDYQLTILHAGAGYGKSTALAGFANASLDVAWYRVSEEDTDPLVFLLHLCHATQITLPDIDNLPFSKIHNWNGTQGPLPTQEIVIQYINAIQEQINEPLLIVIDDIHLIHEVQEIAYILDHLIGLAPANLHFVLSSRRLLKLPNLSRWRGQGKVLSLDKHVLAFSSSEIETLFNTHYGYEISEGDAEQLSQLTEGWAITLQLFWQGLRSGALVSINELASRSEETLDSLFALLATEVFDKQPIDIQQFLKETSVLQRMSPDACEAIFDFSDSRAIMAYLRRQELFVMENGADELRYHNIFHQFLQQQLSVETAGELHQKAATYYLDQKIFDLAIYHFMQAKDFASTADLLTEYGRQLQSEGRLDSLATYLDAIPPEILAKYPILLFMLGNLARLHSRFQEALGWYQQAERLWREAGQVENVARALRGQARVYLDTINPSKAESLLQQALRLSDRIEDLEAQARLFELLSENKLNLGKMEEAEALSKKAQLLRLEGPADEQLQFRVLLRTGQLEEARLKLEASAEYEKENPVQTPRGHRETQLLLSIICAFQGDAAAALSTAELGMKRGQDLDSPFIIAVAHMRQGHALALDQRPGAMQRARSEFQKAIDLSQYLSVPRKSVV